MLIQLPTNDRTSKIIACAIAVHEELGPGLLENTYKACLLQELGNASLRVAAEVPVPVLYKGVRVDCGYRLDLVVADVVVIEVKAVERLLPLHTAQLVTYLRLACFTVGLLINFNTAVLKNGIRRVLNDSPSRGPRVLRV